MVVNVTRSQPEDIFISNTSRPQRPVFLLKAGYFQSKHHNSTFLLIHKTCKLLRLWLNTQDILRKWPSGFWSLEESGCYISPSIVWQKHTVHSIPCWSIPTLSQIILSMTTLPCIAWAFTFIPNGWQPFHNSQNGGPFGYNQEGVDRRYILYSLSGSEI